MEVPKEWDTHFSRISVESWICSTSWLGSIPRWRMLINTHTCKRLSHARCCYPEFWTIWASYSVHCLLCDVTKLSIPSNIQNVQFNFVCDYTECPLRIKKQVSGHKSVLFLVNAHLQLIFGNRCLAAVLKCDKLLLQ